MTLLYYFFDSTLFHRLRQKYKNIYVLFLFQVKTLRLAFEIYWNLTSFYRTLLYVHEWCLRVESGNIKTFKLRIDKYLCNFFTTVLILRHRIKKFKEETICNNISESNIHIEKKSSTPTYFQSKPKSKNKYHNCVREKQKQKQEKGRDK